MNQAIAINEQEIETSINPVIAHAKELKVIDNESYLIAADILKEIVSARGKVAQAFDDLIKDAYSHHRKLIARKNHYDAPLLSAEVKLKAARIAFIQEQERKRREEELRLQEITRKQEEERRLDEAVALENAGMQEEAQRVIDEPQHQIAIVLPPPVPRVEGISHRDNWSAEVTDVMALIKAVAAGEAPILAITPNMKFLNEQARSYKNLLKIPGVKAVSTPIESVKR